MASHTHPLLDRMDSMTHTAPPTEPIVRKIAAYDSSPAWERRLGALAKLAGVRHAAALLMQRVGTQPQRVYDIDLRELATLDAEASLDHLKVAADLLATDRFIHYVETPDERIEEGQLMECDLARVRFAYVIDPSGA